MSRVRAWVHANRLLAGLTAFCLLLILAVGALVIGTISLQRSSDTAGQAKVIAQRAKNLAGELKAQQETYHASRVADQQRTDAEIRGILSCILAARQPTATVECLRSFLAAHPAVPVTPSVTTPSPTRTVVPSRPPQSPAPTVTRTRTAPTPAPATRTVTRTRTPPPRPSSTHPAPKPSPTPTTLCGVLPIPVVC